MKRFMAVVCGVILATIAGLASANYSGVCLSNGSYLSEAEVIKRAAKREFQSHLGKIKYYESIGAAGNRLIRYSSFDDFMARNPNCCMVTRVAREGYEVELIDRLLGWFRSFVRVYYAEEADLNDANHPKMKEVFWAVTNCGYVWNGV